MSEADAFSLAEEKGSLLLPILNVETGSKSQAPKFQHFLPPEKVPLVVTQSDAEFFSNEVEHHLTIVPECWLGDSWHWETIDRSSRLREGHDYTRHDSCGIPHTLVRVIYDLEAELGAFEGVTTESVIAFFVSQQVSDHLWQFAEVFGGSDEAARRAGGDFKTARLLTDEARHWVERQIVRYVQNLISDGPRQSEAKANETLLAAYLERFPNERIPKGDICQAARQDVSHLSKWLRAADGFRRGSQPDICFRELLNQQLPPRAFRPRQF